MFDAVQVGGQLMCFSSTWYFINHICQVGVHQFMYHRVDKAGRTTHQARIVGDKRRLRVMPIFASHLADLALLKGNFIGQDGKGFKPDFGDVHAQQRHNIMANSGGCLWAIPSRCVKNILGGQHKRRVFAPVNRIATQQHPFKAISYPPANIITGNWGAAKHASRLSALAA